MQSLSTAEVCLCRLISYVNKSLIYRLKTSKIVLLVKVGDFLITVPTKESVIFCSVDLNLGIERNLILSKCASKSKHY